MRDDYDEMRPGWRKDMEEKFVSVTNEMVDSGQWPKPGDELLFHVNQKLDEILKFYKELKNRVDEIENRQSDYEDLENKIDDLNAEVEDLRSVFDDSNVDDLKDRISDTESTLEDLKDTLRNV